MMTLVKNVTSQLKICVFCKFLSFKLINRSSLATRKCGGNFTSIPYQRLRSQNRSVRIGLAELTEPSDIQIISGFLNIAFYKLLYTYFCFLYLCGTKSFLFQIFQIGFGVAFLATVLKVQCFLCSLCKVIWNQRFTSYCRYNLLVIEIKAFL